MSRFRGSRSRTLVITADDLGYCAERNRGIVEAFQSNTITRASLLLNASYTLEAVALATEHHIPLGLHLNITEGSPISPKDEVHSLLTPDNFFRGKEGFRSSLANGGIHLVEVRTEISNQIRRFEVLTGRLPIYVDGHQHVHVLAGVRDVFSEALSEAGILSTRLPLERGIDRWSWIPCSRRKFYSSVVKDATEARIVFRKHNVKFSDGFVGMATMGLDMSRLTLEDALYTAFIYAEREESSIMSDESGAGDPKLNCDIKHTVNSDNKRSWPGALALPCDAEHLSANTSSDHPSSLNSELCETQGPGTDNFSHNESVTRISTVHHCDTALVAVNQVKKLPVLDPSCPAHEVELMVHPGYPCIDENGGCGDGPDDFARSSDRLHELNVLKQHWLRAFLEANSIQLRYEFKCQS